MLVAADAEWIGYPALHYYAEFDLIASITGQLSSFHRVLRFACPQRWSHGALPSESIEDDVVKAFR